MTDDETFALIKSDAVRQGHTGLIIASIESRGFQIVGLQKFLPMRRAMAWLLYHDHVEKPYYKELVDSVAGPDGAVAMILRCPDAVAAWRAFMGPTDPWNVPGESLRHRFRGAAMPHNALHGSDSRESYLRERDIFFGLRPR